MPLTVHTYDRDRSLDLRVGHHPDDEVRAQLASVFADPAIATLRRLKVYAQGPTQPETDLRWVLDAVAGSFDRIFVGGAQLVTFDGLARVCAPGARLDSFNWATHFRGAFPAIRTLDLRDALLHWHECVWPDLEVLVLRPRHAQAGPTWVRAMLATAASLPRLREVRFPESRGDDLVPALLDSPLLPQLRCVDFTENITNRGAELLYEHADRVAHLDELWIGSMDDHRGSLERMAPTALFPRGTLEIDDAWASRLRAKLGAILRFDARPGYPDL